MSPQGFKDRVGSLIHTLVEAYMICSLRFTSGVTPLPPQQPVAFPHMHVSAEVGCHDLNRRPPT